MNSTLVATLIANPATEPLRQDYVDAACVALGSDQVIWLSPNEACDIEISPNQFFDAKQTQTQLASSLAKAAVDIIVQPVEGRRKNALIADMDSTMIDQECIDELAQRAGIKDKVADITARAMNGEIEFESALKERVSLLAGLEMCVIDEVLENQITLASGGTQLLATMVSNDAYAALVSGGFTSFANKIANTLGFHEARANTLLEKNGKLTGNVGLPILGQQAKVDALNDICQARSLSARDFIAVGDGANDLAMLGVAGSGVALHAKPSVAAQADMRVDHGDLTALLFIQGYKRDEFVTP